MRVPDGLHKPPAPTTPALTYTSYLTLYTADMKRLQIYIDEAVDDELARRAVREGTSKAALIRAYVAERLGGDRTTRDPLDALVGRYDAEPGSIDELVYGS